MSDERGGDYVEQHYVLDVPRLDSAAIDECIQIPVGDNVDVVKIDLTDSTLDIIQEN